jgi:hypothetical protein
MRDLARDAPHPLEGPQAQPDHDPPEGDQGQDHPRANQRLDEDKPPERLIYLAQRHGDHEGPATGDRERRRAVAQRRAGLRIDREQVKPCRSER